jgi:hypothetical protein
MHPFVGDFSTMKDSEVESKITDLTKKYFMTTNVEVKQQISLLLDDYKAEMSRRRDAQLKKLMDQRDKSLDKLIKVD